MKKITIELQERMNFKQGDIFYVYIDDKIVLSKEFNNGKTNEENIKKMFNKAIELIIK